MKCGSQSAFDQAPRNAAAQVTPTNIVYALVDSSDWIQGVELRLCMTPPKQPFQRCARAALPPAARTET